MIKPIKHIEALPGTQMQYSFLEMIDTFNQMIDVFNAQMVRKGKIEVPSEGCSVCMGNGPTSFIPGDHRGIPCTKCAVCDTIHCVKMFTLE